MGKKLSKDEKEKVRAYAMVHADTTRGQVFRIDVADELTDDGIAKYMILYMEEKVVPKDFKI